MSKRYIEEETKYVVVDVEHRREGPNDSGEVWTNTREYEMSPRFDTDGEAWTWLWSQTDTGRDRWRVITRVIQKDVTAQVLAALRK